MLEVRSIVDKNDPCIPIISDWLMEWWGKSYNFSSAKMLQYTKNHVNNNISVPQVYGLFEDDNIIGMFFLSNSDLDVHPEIYPWLINAFIAPEHRGKGHFNILMSSVLETAAFLRLEKLYLYTEHTGLYEKFGFDYVGDINTYINSDNDIRRLYCVNIIMSDL